MFGIFDMPSSLATYDRSWELQQIERAVWSIFMNRKRVKANTLPPSGHGDILRYGGPSLADNAGDIRNAFVRELVIDIIIYLEIAVE